MELRSYLLWICFISLIATQINFNNETLERSKVISHQPPDQLNSNKLNSSLSGSFEVLAEPKWAPLASSIDGTIGLNGLVNAIIIRGNDVYIGGSFSHIGDNKMEVNNIVRWNRLSKTWHALSENGSIGVGGTVFALEFVGDYLYIGGDFRNLGGRYYESANNIVRWDGKAFSELSGNPAGQSQSHSGLGGPVYALASDGNDLYIGGRFDHYGRSPSKYDPGNYFIRDGTIVHGPQVNNIIIWAGASWRDVGDSGFVGLNGTVLAISVSKKGVFIGGHFTEAHHPGPGRNSPPRLILNHICKYKNGWIPLEANGKIGLNNTVRTISADNKDVYIGGKFTMTGGTDDGMLVNHLVKWNTAAGKWNTISDNNKIGINGDVNSIACYEGLVFIGGNFTSEGGAPANYILRWDGEHFRTLSDNQYSGYGTEKYGGVNAIAATSPYVFSGGTVSRLGSANGTLVNNIATYYAPDILADCPFFDTLFVSDKLRSGVNGKNWDSALGLQEALEMANKCENIKVLKIGPGIYHPTKDHLGNPNPTDPRSKVFLVSRPYALVASYRAAYGPNQRFVLSGDFKNNDYVNDNNTYLQGISLNDENAYKVIVFSGPSSNGASMEGITVSGGNNGGSDFEYNGQNISSINGAGISAYQCNINLNKCMIKTNQAVNDGAGLYIKGGYVIANDCKFLRNSAAHGGAIYLRDFAGKPSVFTQNQIYSNYATNKGGAIYSENSLHLNTSKIYWNEAGSGLGEGGGIYLFGKKNVVIENSLIAQNNSSKLGGGIYTEDIKLEINNSTIADNASGTGGGLYATCNQNNNHNGFTLTELKKTILWGNKAATKDLGISNEKDCIIYYKYVDVQLNENNVQVIPDWSINYWNNITADPLFVNPSNLNYSRLKDTSPCKNMGHNF